MRYYIAPFVLCLCIVLFIFKRSSAIEKGQKISMVLLIAMLCMGVVWAVISMIQPMETLIFSRFLVAAMLCQNSAYYFVKLQEKEKLLSQRQAYATLMVLWMSLVLSFLLEAGELQRVLEAVG